MTDLPVWQENNIYYFPLQTKYKMKKGGNTIMLPSREKINKNLFVNICMHPVLEWWSISKIQAENA